MVSCSKATKKVTTRVTGFWGRIRKAGRLTLLVFTILASLFLFASVNAFLLKVFKAATTPVVVVTQQEQSAHSGMSLIVCPLLAPNAPALSSSNFRCNFETPTGSGSPYDVDGSYGIAENKRVDSTCSIRRMIPASSFSSGIQAHTKGQPCVGMMNGFGSQLFFQKIMYSTCRAGISLLVLNTGRHFFRSDEPRAWQFPHPIG